MSKLRKQLVTLTAAATLAMPMAAMATNGILPLGNGMVAHGFGGAGIANATETMSGVDNPALVANTTNQWAVGGSIFMPYRSADAGGGTYVDSDSNLFLIPQGGYTSAINGKMAWGILAYAMGGMNTDYPDASKFDSHLPAVPVGMNLSGAIVAPTFSYKLNEDNALGVSLLYGYEKMETKGPGGLTGFPGNESDSATGTGFKFGYHGKFGSTTVGAFYQTAIAMSEMSFCQSVFAGLKAAGHDCTLDLPDQYGAGVTYRFNPDWMVVGDVIQVNWSNVDVFHYGFGWDDQTIYKIGAEYKLGEGRALRVGYNHGDSPIPQDKVGLNILAPAITEDHYTVGYGMKAGSNAELNMYYAYIPQAKQSGTGYSNAPPAPSGATARLKMYQHAFGVSYNKHF